MGLEWRLCSRILCGLTGRFGFCPMGLYGCGFVGYDIFALPAGNALVLDNATGGLLLCWIMPLVDYSCVG